MKEIKYYGFGEDPYYFETDGSEFLHTLKKPKLLEPFGDAEVLEIFGKGREELTKQEIISYLLDDEAEYIYDYWSSAMDDYYYDTAQSEYNDLQQQIMESKSHKMFKE